MIEGSIQLEGADKVLAKLMKLEVSGAKKAVRKGLREASKPMLKAAKMNAGSMVGGEMGRTIQRSLTVRAAKKTRQKVIQYKIEHSKKYNPQFVAVSSAGRRNYIPSAIEYGHDNAQPIPYMRSAFDSNKASTAQLAVKTIGTAIEIEAAKK